MPMGKGCVSCSISIRCKDGRSVSGSCFGHYACCCTCGDDSIAGCIIVEKNCPGFGIRVVRCCSPT